ncbi:asparaginase [Romboutsia sp.]|uniref:asparaginase n=1 Tax=Romboutsia sp. TaxID=1965302 RepID=UPI002C891F89|nr:asparaginase [Romboutsia sp.]HSQ88344.1 asparaginase [Romboutsia sp.]
MKSAINVYRGKLVECTHNAHVAVVDIDKNLLKYYGNPKEIIYARSGVKPIQAIQVLETGACEKYHIEDREVALICSSHSSEKYHVRAVESILNKAEIDEDKLNCGTHIPFNTDVYKKIIESGEAITQKYHNCAGKHCGMLISAKHMGEDLDTYLEISHPLQQRIIENLSIVCEYDKSDILIGLDGCGAPVHALELQSLAYGFAQMANPKKLPDKEKYINKITKAMIDFPEMVGGTDRFCTELMKVCKGRIFGKMGSQGVYLVGHKEKGIGIAVKIEDGSTSATSCLVLEVLSQMKLISKEERGKLIKFATPKILNARGEIVGEMKAEFKLI